MRAFIGIDPGLEGAAVKIYGGYTAFLDTPILHTTDSTKRNRRIYDEAQMAKVLRDLTEPNTPHFQGEDGVIAVIEQVHSMPKQGVASSFTFGMGYGIWLGILAALRIPYVRVTPQRWKKEVMMDGPKTDQAVIAFATRLYPTVSQELRTPRGKLLLGRADALLIAHWQLIRERDLSASLGSATP